jgi:RNA polymerase sigma-70 factor (ECF subfamily)
VEEGPPIEGDTAFDRLVRDHADAVYGFVRRRVAGAEAADLAQETFLRAWRGRRGLREQVAARGWLLAIAANVVRDHARRARVRPIEVAEVDPPSSAGDPAARAAGAEDVRRLGSALRAMPPNHREMFLLRERDGLTYREIAAVLRCPVGSVMSGLARARERLLEALES